jgi:DNA-binding NarL/FixJ family response regulator
MKTRWLIVDDHQGFLETARRILERQGLTVLGVATTGDEALERMRELKPDGVLVDIVLGAESGFELARRLTRAVDPPPMVILISTHAEEDFASLIAQSPAIGFLPKSDLSAPAICEIVQRCSGEAG